MGFSEWKCMLVCSCGWRTIAPFGIASLARIDCCPECGLYKPRNSWSLLGDWSVVRMRYRSYVVWWNPLTWFSRGDWETHPDDMYKIKEIDG